MGSLPEESSPENKKAATIAKIIIDKEIAANLFIDFFRRLCYLNFAGFCLQLTYHQSFIEENLLKEMKGFIVYPTYTSSENETWIHLFGRLENGESFLATKKF